MIRKPYSLVLRGKSGKEYTFRVNVDPAHIHHWESEGFQLDGPIVGWIPMWAVQLGLTKPWLFVQDVFNFRNPFI